MCKLYRDQMFMTSNVNKTKIYDIKYAYHIANFYVDLKNYYTCMIFVFGLKPIKDFREINMYVSQILN